MNPYFLLIDFGASNTKAALFDVAEDQFLDTKIFPSLKNSATDPKCVELSTKALHQQFIEIVRYYHQNHGALAGILLCSQMHGFILLDKENQPLTEYISWQDERSLQSIAGVSSFAMLEETFRDSYQTISGMKPRPGLPIANILHLAREKKIHNQCAKVVSLPEWLSLVHQDAKSVVHATMLAGSGFLDIEQLAPSTSLVNFIHETTGYQLRFNELAPENTIAGYFHLDDTKIPIHVGVGDHQCALLGAHIDESMISLNIGTGSQVSVLDSKKKINFLEKRPYFGKDILSAQTHIPAGRALNEYLAFLTTIVQETTGQVVSFWPYLNKLTVDDILQSTLSIDLALFQSAVNYQSGGKISGIKMGNLNLKAYLASLLKNFMLQYVSHIEKIGGQNGASLKLSGGIPRKLPVIVDVIHALTGLKINSVAKMDETLLGLRLQALMIVNNTDDYKETMQLCLTV